MTTITEFRTPISNFYKFHQAILSDVTYIYVKGLYTPWHIGSKPFINVFELLVRDVRDSSIQFKIIFQTLKSDISKKKL